MNDDRILNLDDNLDDSGLENAIMRTLQRANTGKTTAQLQLDGGHTTVTAEKGNNAVEVYYYDNRCRVTIDWNGAASEQVNKIVTALLKMEQYERTGEVK